MLAKRTIEAHAWKLEACSDAWHLFREVRYQLYCNPRHQQLVHHPRVRNQKRNLKTGGVPGGARFYHRPTMALTAQVLRSHLLSMLRNAQISPFFIYGTATSKPGRALCSVSTPSTDDG